MARSPWCRCFIPLQLNGKWPAHDLNAGKAQHQVSQAEPYISEAACMLTLYPCVMDVVLEVFFVVSARSSLSPFRCGTS